MSAGPSNSHHRSANDVSASCTAAARAVSAAATATVAVVKQRYQSSAVSSFTLYQWYLGVGAMVIVTIWMSNFRHMAQIASVEQHKRLVGLEPPPLQQRHAQEQSPVATADSTAGDTQSADGTHFHIVFSTGCNAFQDWQSYVMFHQVWKSGQTGHVTRVASDCKTDAAADELRTVFAQQIQTIPTGRHRFHLHITPDYSKTVIPGLDYKFFNKPHGLRHWMQHGLGWPGTAATYADTHFIILDPDQFILRPFTTTRFGSDATSRWKKKSTQGPEWENQVQLRVGQPVSQLYGFGANFLRKLDTNITHIVQSVIPTHPAEDPSSSHLYHWTADEVETSYAAGPPYMATGRDMYRLVDTWATMVAPVYELSVDHLSEMYAYSTAAAHLQLPHALAYSFMISEPSTRLEGWDMIDALAPEETCRYTSSNASDPDNVAWRHTLPHIVHYCQRYFLGPYFFNKYKLPHSFLSCEHALVLDPTTEDSVIAETYDSAVTPNNEVNHLTPFQAKRHAFFLCHTIARLNEAATYWKQQHCAAGTANFKKEYVVPFDPPK